jgi:hypothetical protein
LLAAIRGGLALRLENDSAALEAMKQVGVLNGHERSPIEQRSSERKKRLQPDTREPAEDPTQRPGQLRKEGATVAQGSQPHVA